MRGLAPGPRRLPTRPVRPSRRPLPLDALRDQAAPPQPPCTRAPRARPPHGGPPRVNANGTGGHGMTSDEPSAPVQAASAPTGEDYSGVWISHYEFFSSSRENTFTGLHHVVLSQHGNRITGRYLPGASSNPDSPLSFDLTVDRNVVTGSWVEQTAQDGYYQGARYHGAIQLLVDPTGRRMAGKWVGFGKEFDVNSGPWELRLLDRSTADDVLGRYSVPPEA
ncbi:XRE family transcriptional regulator [Kitasatospora sp. NPDC096204]|uniref:XRE family transcriptional regulator n=1 Tax=Kitasatospora sp. NPDC096204 TaxID=3364094 RepID=UPI0037F52582